MGDEDLHERARLLDNDSEDEDDFFLRGPTTSGIKKQLDEVTDIARDNVLKLADRGETNIKKPLVLWLSISTNDTPAFHKFYSVRISFLMCIEID